MAPDDLATLGPATSDLVADVRILAAAIQANRARTAGVRGAKIGCFIGPASVSDARYLGPTPARPTLPPSLRKTPARPPTTSCAG